MDRLDPGSFDAILTDPPYCSGSITEAGKQRADGQGLRRDSIGERRRFSWFEGDNLTSAGLCWLLRSVGVSATRLLKPTGSMLVFCDWRMLPQLAPAIESAGLRYRGLIVWDKGSMGLGNGFRCQHELVMHFTVGRPEYHDRGVGNVIRARRLASERRIHPTQKPVALIEELLKVVAPPGGWVLDPFAGSGSTAVACQRAGVNFVGVDRDELYIEKAVERTQDRLPLFDEEGEGK